METVEAMARIGGLAFLAWGIGSWLYAVTKWAGHRRANRS